MSIWSHLWSRDDRPEDKSFTQWEYTLVDLATASGYTDNLRLAVGPGGTWGETTELTPDDVRSLRDALTAYLDRIERGGDR